MPAQRPCLVTVACMGMLAARVIHSTRAAVVLTLRAPPPRAAPTPGTPPAPESGGHPARRPPSPCPPEFRRAPRDEQGVPTLTSRCSCRPQTGRGGWVPQNPHWWSAVNAGLIRVAVGLRVRTARTGDRPRGLARDQGGAVAGEGAPVALHPCGQRDLHGRQRSLAHGELVQIRQFGAVRVRLVQARYLRTRQGRRIRIVELVGESGHLPGEQPRGRSALTGEGRVGHQRRQRQVRGPVGRRRIAGEHLRPRRPVVRQDLLRVLLFRETGLGQRDEEAVLGAGVPDHDRNLVPGPGRDGLGRLPRQQAVTGRRTRSRRRTGRVHQRRPGSRAQTGHDDGRIGAAHPGREGPRLGLGPRAVRRTEQRARSALQHGHAPAPRLPWGRQPQLADRRGGVGDAEELLHPAVGPAAQRALREGHDRADGTVRAAGGPATPDAAPDAARDAARCGGRRDGRGEQDGQCKCRTG